MNQEHGVFEQLDLFSMIKDILRQWWVIVLLSLAAALFTNVYKTETFQPEYTVKTTFVVTAKGTNSSVYSNLSSTMNMAEQFKKVLEFNLLKTTVCNDLGIETFDARTNITVVENTNMIRMNVTSGSAVLAYRITKSILRNYHEVSDYVLSNVVLEIMEPPTIPNGPSNAQNIMNYMKRAAIFMAVICIFIFAVVSYMKDTVKNEEDAKRKVDARLLGTIYREKKKKRLNDKSRSMIVTNPLMSYKFVECFRMASAKMANRMEKHHAKVVLITSVSENEGKSTVAANLALCLAQENKNVILIDCDFRKPALYKIFGAGEDLTIDLPGVLMSGDIPNDFIHQLPESKLFTIFNRQQSFILEEMITTGTFKKIMKFVRGRMDYVILDTSPLALVSDTEQIAEYADASVVVMAQDRILSRDINDTIDALNNTNAKVIGCIFNNVTKVAFHSTIGG